jgi:hypothetical protein
MALFNPLWLMQINVNAAIPISLAKTISKYSLSCPKSQSKCLSDCHSHLSISAFSSSDCLESRVCFVWSAVKDFSVFVCFVRSVVKDSSFLCVSFQVLWKIFLFCVFQWKCCERFVGFVYFVWSVVKHFSFLCPLFEVFLKKSHFCVFCSKYCERHLICVCFSGSVVRGAGIKLDTPCNIADVVDPD